MAKFAESTHLAHGMHNCLTASLRRPEKVSLRVRVTIWVTARSTLVHMPCVVRDKVKARVIGIWETRGIGVSYFRGVLDLSLNKRHTL